MSRDYFNRSSIYLEGSNTATETERKIKIDVHAEENMHDTRVNFYHCVPFPTYHKYRQSSMLGKVKC
jgi:phage FluMu gp28-like protein